MKFALTRDKAFPIIFLMFILLHLFMMGGLRIFPFLDVPNHLAASTIYRYYGEPTNSFSENFAVSMYVRPNIFHFLLCAQDVFPDVETANRFFYCLYVLLLPLSVLLLIRKLGGNPWAALMSFLFIYNFNVSYGFTGFTIAIPSALLLFYFMLGYLEDRHPARGALLAGFFMLLFFMHIIPTVLMLMVFALCCILGRGRGLKRILGDGLVVLPVLLLIFVWWRFNTTHSSRETLGHFFVYYQSGYFRTLLKRGSLLFLDNFSLYEGIAGCLVASLISVIVTAPVLYMVFFRRKKFLEITWREKYLPLYVFVFGSLFCFLFLPQDIPDEIHLFYQRFSVFFFLGVILLTSLIISKKKGSFEIAALCLLCLLHYGAWSDYFRQFSREVRTFTAGILPDDARNKKLAGLIFDYRFRGRPIYIHFPDYYTVWKRGVACTFLIDCGLGSFGSTKRKAGKQVLPEYLRWIGKDNYYDGRYEKIGYLLVRGKMPDEIRGQLSGFNKVKQQGKWRLYQNTDRAESILD